MQMIRVMIVDDQTLMRQGLCTIINLEEDMQVVALAADGLEALELAATANPDVVLMDIRMPRLDGVACTRELRSRLPAIKVLVLTTFADDEYIVDCLRNGASGYLLKDLEADALVRAIREAHAGVVLMQPEIAARLVAQATRPLDGPRRGFLEEKLTQRELEILERMVRGLANRQIAAELFLSEGTVKNYVSLIYEKLQVSDRTQAVLLAQEHLARR